MLTVRRKLRNFLVGWVCSLLIVSCGKSDSFGNYGWGNGPLGISLDESVPPQQAQILSEDLEFLSEMQVPAPLFPHYLTIVGVTDFSATTLVQWLQQRVKVVVGENFNYDRLKVRAESRNYNPRILSRDKDEVSRIQTVMFNLGSWLYLNGKESSIVYSLPVVGTSVLVTTPRVGIIQIGEGLFDANSVKSSDVRAEVNRLLRIAVFFHEARHGDSNGANAAFPHAKCVSGDYKDKNSCENNLNGPYVVEAVLLHQFYYGCKSCTTPEYTQLQAFIYDNKSRILPGATMQDERPEGL